MKALVSGLFPLLFAFGLTAQDNPLVEHAFQGTRFVN